MMSALGSAAPAYPWGMTDPSAVLSLIPQVIAPKARKITGANSTQTQPLILGEALIWGRPRSCSRPNVLQRARLVSTPGWARIRYDTITAIEISDSTGSKISFGRVAAFGALGLLARKRKVTARVVVTTTTAVHGFEVDGWNAAQLADAFRPLTRTLTL